MKGVLEQSKGAVGQVGQVGQLGFKGFRRAAGKLLAVLRRWQQLSYERRLLATLDSRMLRDIGVSRAEAERESARPFWDEKGVKQRHIRHS
jgi:uncharacterized protein YjiS (DUF1127 family)